MNSGFKVECAYDMTVIVSMKNFQCSEVSLKHFYAYIYEQIIFLNYVMHPTMFLYFLYGACVCTAIIMQLTSIYLINQNISTILCITLVYN